MNKRVENLQIGDDAPEGLINDESMAAARALVGNKLRPEQYLRDASVDSITIFANGVGDLNPLYRDVLAHYGVVALPCRVEAGSNAFGATRMHPWFTTKPKD